MKSLWMALVIGIVMVSAATAQEAQPATPAAPEFVLTVNGGTGGGSYAAGKVVAVASDAPPPGKVFDKWTGDVAALNSVEMQSAKLTMPERAAAITATFKDAPADAMGAFLEMNGIMVAEAEHFTSKAPGKDAFAAIQWEEVKDYAGAIGSLMQALPNDKDTQVNAGDKTDGPVLNFKVYFQNPGTYYVFMRIPPLGGSDNSINYGMDGAVVKANVHNGAGRWNWNVKEGTAPITIEKPGVHTMNIWMRENGVAVDRLMVRNENKPLTSGDDPAYPPESPIIKKAEARE